MTPRAATAPRKVTRDDVARYAGVSSAVVSYVINNGPKRVAPETELRVRAAVEELGYRPNLTARALSSGSTHTLGLILTDWLNPFFAELAQAVELAAAERGHAVLMAHSKEDASTEQQRVGDLEGRQVDGLLVSTMLGPDDLADWATRRSHQGGPPIVLLNAERAVPGFLAVGPDFATGSRAAVQHLIEHGHPRVALITGAGDGAEPREEGWRVAHQEAGLRPGPIGRGGYTRESGYAMARRLLTGRRPPTAIFAVSDLMAVGVLRAAHELGLQVGSDLAVACFDGTRESEYAWPPLTAVRQPLTAMAAAAVHAVLGIEPATGRLFQEFRTELVIRRSCGCPEHD